MLRKNNDGIREEHLPLPFVLIVTFLLGYISFIEACTPQCLLTVVDGGSGDTET